MSDPSPSPRNHHDLDQLKRQAKELLKAFLAGDTDAHERVRARFRSKPGWRLGDRFALHDAQHVVAGEQGFESWPKLKRHVEAQLAPRFFAAARSGDLRLIKRFVAQNPRLAIRWVHDRDEHTAIHFAAREGHVDIVRFLLQHGADPEAGVYPNRHITRAIDFAVMRGHQAVIDAIERHLQQSRGAGMSPSPLLAAIGGNDLAAVRNLLDADPALATARTGALPLHAAAYYGRMEIIALLLDRGADPDVPDPDGRRPVQYAMYGGHPFRAPGHPQGAELLLQRGATLDLWTAAGLGRIDAVRAALLADPAAAARPIVDLQKPLRAWRPSPGHAPIWPVTVLFPLSISAFRGHTEICRLLLDCGADPDASFHGPFPGDLDREFGFPLLFAVCRSNYELVEMLLNAGATPDANLRGIGGVLWHPQEKKDQRMISLLTAAGHPISSPPSLLEIDRFLRDSIVAHLRANPADAPGVKINALLRDDPDLFLLAESLMPEPDRDMDDILFRLLGFKNARLPDQSARVRTIRVFLARVRNINRRGNEGMTALHVIADVNNRQWMADQTRVELAGLLLDRGIDPHLKDDDYCTTALGWAARAGYVELVRFLLARGVKAELPDDQPWATPLAWAQREGHQEIVRLLSNLPRGHHP